MTVGRGSFVLALFRCFNVLFLCVFALSTPEIFSFDITSFVPPCLASHLTSQQLLLRAVLRRLRFSPRGTTHQTPYFHTIARFRLPPENRILAHGSSLYEKTLLKKANLQLPGAKEGTRRSRPHSRRQVSFIPARRFMLHTTLHFAARRQLHCLWHFRTSTVSPCVETPPRPSPFGLQCALLQSLAFEGGKGGKQPLQKTRYTHHSQRDKIPGKTTVFFLQQVSSHNRVQQSLILRYALDTIPANS